MSPTFYLGATFFKLQDLVENLIFHFTPEHSFGAMWLSGAASGSSSDTAMTTSPPKGDTPSSQEARKRWDEHTFLPHASLVFIRPDSTCSFSKELGHFQREITVKRIKHVKSHFSFKLHKGRQLVAQTFQTLCFRCFSNSFLTGFSNTLVCSLSLLHSLLQVSKWRNATFPSSGKP